MVSLEDRISYIDRVKTSQKIRAFYYFLLDKNVADCLNELNDVDEVFLNIISSIQANNRTKFENVYIKKSKSNPSRDSPTPFVNDDYFIFCLIIAIVRFDIDKKWISNIISIRSRNATTITFENILNENYYSTSNQPEIILVFLSFCNKSLITNNLLNMALKCIIENVDLSESKNDFHILCALRAYDLIIEQKEAADGSEISLLKEFNRNFSSRIKLLSWILQCLIMGIFIYSLSKLPIYSPETILFIEKFNFIFTIVGASGITVLGNQISFIKNKSEEFLMSLLGYPKGLSKRTASKSTFFFDRYFFYLLGCYLESYNLNHKRYRREMETPLHSKIAFWLIESAFFHLA